jgi:quercetin dioxygenase-like cupin family protein
MKIIRLDEIAGKSITQYDSNLIMRKLLMTDKPSHVGIMHLEAGGIVRYHDAIMPQMLIIIEGEGWVRTGTEDKVKVNPGDVVLWEQGEGHETTSNFGMKAIIIESEGLNVNSFGVKNT